jgi:hypothetical protein
MAIKGRGTTRPKFSPVVKTFREDTTTPPIVVDEGVLTGKHDRRVVDLEAQVALLKSDKAILVAALGILLRD